MPYRRLHCGHGVAVDYGDNLELPAPLFEPTSMGWSTIVISPLGHTSNDSMFGVGARGDVLSE